MGVNDPGFWPARIHEMVREHSEGMRRNKDQAEDVALLAACRDLCARAMGAATIFSLYDFSIEEVSEYLAAFFPPRRR